MNDGGLTRRTQIFESHALPHLYASTATYTRGGIRPTPDGKTGRGSKDGASSAARLVLARHASLFDEAFRAFRSFFQLKTGLAWEQRLERQEEKDREANADGGRFRYLAPQGRLEPKGVLPEHVQRVG